MTSGGIHAYLSGESYFAWQTFADINGVTLTSLLEAIGLHLDGPELRQCLKPCVTEAQRITVERRRRRPDP